MFFQKKYILSKFTRALCLSNSISLICSVLFYSVLFYSCVTSKKSVPYTKETPTGEENTISMQHISNDSSGLSSKFDTIEVSVEKKTRSGTKDTIVNLAETRSFYTVQIGAFNNLANAVQKQLSAKKQFSHLQVFNNYDESAKLYYVSIGMYKEFKDASELADSLKRMYPDEYKECWVRIVQ